MNDRMCLPRSEQKLDVEALSRIFNDTTNSYKLLFFRAVLSMIGAGKSNNQRNLLLSDITAKMLVSTWIINVYYHLSFGSSDRLSSIMSELALDTVGCNLASSNHESRLEINIRESLRAIDSEEIQRYVPYRVLRPFFSDETRGIPDWRVNQKIQECAEASFATQKPAPYMIIFNHGESSIKINDYWWSYFERHLKILIEWTDWHLASYLQRRNPNVPSIASKLYLPKRRRPLLWQRRLWTSVFSQRQVRCIYSNEVIKQYGFHLDHYLPWSFVCHDEAWNLIPVAPAVNSAKSNALPSSRYLPAFIDLQAHALSAARKTLSISDWDTVCSSYAAGLRIDCSEFARRDVFGRSLEETIIPLTSIAKRMGFASDWEFGVNER